MKVITAFLVPLAHLRRLSKYATIIISSTWVANKMATRKGYEWLIRRGKEDDRAVWEPQWRLYNKNEKYGRIAQVWKLLKTNAMSRQTKYDLDTSLQLGMDGGGSLVDEKISKSNVKGIEICKSSNKRAGLHERVLAYIMKQDDISNLLHAKAKVLQRQMVKTRNFRWRLVEHLNRL